MLNLHTVRFTTRVITNKYDAKGKLMCVDLDPKEVCITALPYATAMSYKACDNFTIEPYVFEQRRAASKDRAEKHEWAAPATKKVQRGAADYTERTTTAAAPKVSKTATAARTGDLAAAVSQ